MEFNLPSKSIYDINHIRPVEWELTKNRQRIPLITNCFDYLEQLMNFSRSFDYLNLREKQPPEAYRGREERRIQSSVSITTSNNQNGSYMRFYWNSTIRIGFYDGIYWFLLLLLFLIVYWSAKRNDPRISLSLKPFMT